MKLHFLFFAFGLAVTATSKDQSLQTESTIYPVTVPLKDPNNTSHMSRKASTKSLPRLTVPLIASPGMDLFHAPLERYHSTPVNAITAMAEEMISSSGEMFVSNLGSGSFTLNENNTATTVHLASGADLLISDKKEEESIVTTAQARSGHVLNSIMTAVAHLSRDREKIATSLYAPLTTKNQKIVESITFLPAKSIPMQPASHAAVFDDLGEATETVERQSKNINENGALKSLAAPNPLNTTESIFDDGEKTFVEKGSSTKIHLTAVLNRIQLVTEGGDVEVKMVAQEPGVEFKAEQSGQKNMLALNLATHRNTIFDAATPLPLRLTSQRVDKVEANGTKSNTTLDHAMKVYTNHLEEKPNEFKFSQPSEVPFPKTGKVLLTRSFTTPSLTRNLQKNLSAGDKSEGEPMITSTREGKEKTTVHSLSQSLQSSQSTTQDKDEERLNFQTDLPSRFTERTSVLIKVKNATQPERDILIVPQNISYTDSNVFHKSEECCKVSIENGTLYPQGKENPDKLSQIDNQTEHFHTLIIKSMSGASSSMPFTVALGIMTLSAQKARDSDSTVLSGRTTAKLNASSLITPLSSMHHSVTSDHPDQLQKISTTLYQTPQRKIQNLSPIFEGHTVTYSPVKQLLIPSLMASAKPLTSLSSPAGHTPAQSARVLKEHPSISLLGSTASTIKSLTFQELKKVQSSTSFHSSNKNREPTVFLKLPTLQSERLISSRNVWPVTGNSSVNTSFVQFTRKAESDKESTFILSVSAVTPAPQTYTPNSPTTTALAKNFASSLSFLDKIKENLLFTSTNKKASQERFPFSSSQDSVSYPSLPAIMSKLSEITERSGIKTDMFTNSKLTTEAAKEKDINHSVHVPASIRNGSGTLVRKTTREMDLRRTFSTEKPLIQQFDLSKSVVESLTSVLDSTDTELLSQIDRNPFSMQNKGWTPATALLQNATPSQSRGPDLQRSTEGQTKASVLPAAIEPFQSAHLLAFSATAKTPKTIGKMINHASSPSSTLSSIINAASNEKEINGPLTPYQTKQHSAFPRKPLQQATSHQAPITSKAPKKHTIKILSISHVPLNSSTSTLPKPFTGSVKFTHPADGLNMEPTSYSGHSATPAKTLTEVLTTLRANQNVFQTNIVPLHIQENVVKQHSTQTKLPSLTEGTFFVTDHTDASMPGSEKTVKESTPTGSLQITDENEDHLSTVLPLGPNLAKSPGLMSDLPVMQRRMRVASPDILSGLAQISDDICGTGNYTAEMRLTLERDIVPGDHIPALGNLHVVINLKTNNSQVNLEIKSCCLSPTVVGDEFNTTCCLFSRLPIDPQGIHLLPSVLSKRASFTISLFQMINYSTAYLHCDLSVCLKNNSECERCQQHRNAHSADNEEIIFSNTRNRISFGPVLKETDESTFTETTGVDSAETAMILGSVSGCFLVCVALLLFWTIYRHHLQKSGHCQCFSPHGCSSNREHFLP